MPGPTGPSSVCNPAPCTLESLIDCNCKRTTSGVTHKTVTSCQSRTCRSQNVVGILRIHKGLPGDVLDEWTERQGNLIQRVQHIGANLYVA